MRWRDVVASGLGVGDVGGSGGGVNVVIGDIDAVGDVAVGVVCCCVLSVVVCVMVRWLLVLLCLVVVLLWVWLMVLTCVVMLVSQLRLMLFDVAIVDVGVVDDGVEGVVVVDGKGDVGDGVARTRHRRRRVIICGVLYVDLRLWVVMMSMSAVMSMGLSTPSPSSSSVLVCVGVSGIGAVGDSGGVDVVGVGSDSVVGGVVGVVVVEVVC